MSLNTTDIGTNPNFVEQNLTSSFKTARSWGAVLLIDEADIFMERRSSQDLQRNSLVAGESRYLPCNCLEYSLPPTLRLSQSARVL